MGAARPSAGTSGRRGVGRCGGCHVARRRRRASTARARAGRGVYGGPPGTSAFGGASGRAGWPAGHCGPSGVTGTTASPAPPDDEEQQQPADDADDEHGDGDDAHRSDAGGGIAPDANEDLGVVGRGRRRQSVVTGVGDVHGADPDAATAGPVVRRAVRTIEVDLVVTVVDQRQRHTRCVLVVDVVGTIVGLAVTVDLADRSAGLDEERVGAGAFELERRGAPDRHRREVGHGVVVAPAGQEPQHETGDHADGQHADAGRARRCPLHHTPNRVATSSIRSSGCTTATRT